MINPFFTAIKPLLTIINTIDVEAKLQMTLQEASSVQLVSLRREPGVILRGRVVCSHRHHRALRRNVGTTMPKTLGLP